MSNLERTRAFLLAFETRDGSAASYYAADVTQRELPNALTKDGATRDLAALKRGMDAGRAATRDEKYTIVTMYEQGDTVALECTWSATLNVPFGAISAGEAMTAHIAMFLTWRDGKIISQRNYDCFEPF